MLSRRWDRSRPRISFGFNSNLQPQTYSPDAALKALQTDGFRLENGVLKDKDRNEVVFSIVTNAGSNRASAWRYSSRMICRRSAST